MLWIANSFQMSLSKTQKLSLPAYYSRSEINSTDESTLSKKYSKHSKHYARRQLHYTAEYDLSYKNLDDIYMQAPKYKPSNL